MNRHYVKEKIQMNGKTFEKDMDCIEFDDYGRITGWFLWSEFAKEWLPIDLYEIKTRWPGKFEDMKDKCRGLAIENYQSSEGA